MTEIRDHFVYRAFDADGVLLYVGCTKRLDKRWSEHRSERPGLVSATERCRLQGPFTRTTARDLERQAIRTEEPLYGFTPTKHREKCARDRWIKQRCQELTDGVADPKEVYSAIARACAEAEELFPDPYEHERVLRRGDASPLHT